MAVGDYDLAETIAKFSEPARGIPFEVVIKALYGVDVMEFNTADNANRQALESIKNAIEQACRDVQAKPIERSRPNEVGNDMEPFVVDALNLNGLKADKPRTTSGKLRATGYPDIHIDRPPATPIYLEVKTYARASHDTSFRSFYLSPSDEPKVTTDAHHLLVGFEIENKDNLYWPVGYEIMDLFGLQCDLKAEFNSDNSRLYDDGRRLASNQVPIKP